MNAIDLLVEQHRKAEQLFAQIAAAAPDQKREIFASLAEELSAHMEIEEQIFYPAVYKVDPHEVNHGQKEHDESRPVITRLLELDSGDEKFDELFQDLTDKMNHHMQEEERDLFPQVRQDLGENRLEELGDEMEDLFAEIKGNADTARKVGFTTKPGDRAMREGL